MPYTVTQAHIVLAFDPNVDSANVPLLPGDVENAWRTAYSALAAELDAACGYVLGTSPGGGTTQLAAQTAMGTLITKLVTTSLPNSSYKRGGAGHGGGAWVCDNLGNQLVHTVTLILAAGTVTVTCYPSVYILVV